MQIISTWPKVFPCVSHLLFLSSCCCCRSVVVVGWIQMCRCESTFGRSKLAININIKIAHQVGHHHFVHSHVATDHHPSTRNSISHSGHVVVPFIFLSPVYLRKRGLLGVLTYLSTCVLTCCLLFATVHHPSSSSSP